jgi:hypothetical protein
MRSALDEFTYLARRIDNCITTFREINVTEPQLEIYRDRSGRVASPPLRICLMRLERNLFKQHS